MSSQEGQSAARPTLTAPAPPSQVLGYFTTLSSITPVRHASRVGVRLVALLLGLYALASFGAAIYFAWADLQSGNTLINSILNVRLPLALIIFFGAIALGLWILARPIEAGSRHACLFANWMLLPAILPPAAMTIISTFDAILMLIAAQETGHSAPRIILGCGMMLLMPICLLISLLISDLSKCLKWIADHPSAEKPPVPFV